MLLCVLPSAGVCYWICFRAVKVAGAGVQSASCDRINIAAYIPLNVACGFASNGLSMIKTFMHHSERNGGEFTQRFLCVDKPNTLELG
jgi:hypothetical protein